jgi:hypothetical protein
MKPKSFLQVGDWKVYTNRARSITEPSIHAAENYLSTQHPTIQRFCNHQITNTTFTYYDTYVGPGKPALVEPEVDTENAVRILARPITNQLADKVKLARSIEAHNLFDHAPKTYFSVEDAIASGGDPNRLMFVKLRSGTRGEHVSCVKHSDLATLSGLTKDHIIQEGINNPALYFNRKVVFRFYIFIFNKQVFISKHGVVIAHGEEYDPNNTDYKIHVQHNGQGAEPLRFPFYGLPGHEVWMEKLKDLSRALLPVLETARNASSLFRYIVLGVDGIPCTDEKVRLVEINAHPSLIKPPMVEPVYVPMFSSVMLMTVAGLNDNTWVKIE